MQIQSSTTNFSASHIYSHTQLTTNLSVATTSARPATPIAPITNSLPAQNDVSSKPKRSDKQLYEAAIYELKLLLLKSLVENLSGKKINFESFYSLEYKQQLENHLTTSSAPPNQQPSSIFYSQTLIEEHELTELEISANINAASGETFDLSLKLSMQRYYIKAEEQLQTQQTMKDPLVINFNERAAQLNAERTTFDIDADGINDSIPTLSLHSAYLALDKNQDGIINSGQELFGAISGNGFQELARYDEDNNGFIDSGDKIFSALLAYRPGDNYSQTLSQLSIGALALDYIDTPFRLTDKNNNTLGQVRATGYYVTNKVTNKGSAGSLQQLDLLV